MKSLSKITKAVATLALIAGVSFSTSYAQTTNKTTNQTEQQAETYTLSGTVTNAQGQAISNAQVTVISNSMMAGNSSSVIATTNKSGQFKLKNVASGSYTVKVKADGYQTAKKQVKVTKDKTLTITLKSSKK